VSVSGPWHFAFWERDMIRRFRRLCALFAFLIFSGLLAARSNDLLNLVRARGGTVSA
jgi:hypothetical protein